MAKRLVLDGQNLQVSVLTDWAFQRQSWEVEIPDAALARVQKSHLALLNLIESKIPIYGVTTGFGDSGSRTIPAHRSEELQKNLVAYLLCGSGPLLPVEASRATLAIRLNSFLRGHSGVSVELIERMQLHMQKDWIPAIPREGSLGASGDLVPLAYLAQVIQGEGNVHTSAGLTSMSEILKREGLEPYRLKAKEGLALVNGTSAMAGLFLSNLTQARFLLDLLCVNTSWLALALRGRTEAFGPLVNAQAKASEGQRKIAENIFSLLQAEDYQSIPLSQIRIEESRTSEWVQDRYSLRCVPQICGPIYETLGLLENWLTMEINSASDNPLIGEAGDLANGGNFYGGYLSHGMDYLKISMAHMADVVDRQISYIIDEKSNRGLPTNLANWNGLSDEDRHLHHGLKGLHQSASAITSEIMARATPGGIFSRSSESHNQDKVSLGMSAGVQAADMLDPLFTVFTLQSAIMAQALDLRGVKLKGDVASTHYALVRKHMPFVSHDRPLGGEINSLRSALRERAFNKGNWT